MRNAAGKNPVTALPMPWRGLQCVKVRNWGIEMIKWLYNMFWFSWGTGAWKWYR